MNKDLEHLKEQVMFNCHISDGKFGGVFSLCGFLLRMRDYYKWEKGLNPWDEPDYNDLLQWIEHKESLWDKTAKEEFRPLILGNENFDPFDVDGINSRLEPSGLLYGAGYVTGMKPSFFLATTSATKSISNISIHILNKEMARDIFTSPAMRQGNHIITRPWAMAALLWDLILEKRPSTLEALKFSLAQFDLDVDEIRRSPKNLGKSLWQMSRDESETWVYHELGEAIQEEFNLEIWQEIVASHSNTIVERTARAVKDLLADTHEGGLFAHIIKHRKKSSLGLYLCFASPISRAFFPEINQAFNLIKSGQNWNTLEKTRQKGFLKASHLAHRLIEFHIEGHRKGEEWVRSRVEAELIQPLGISSLQDH